jgi:hypothetical protein
MLQISIISNLQLLNGTADIMLLALIAWGLRGRGRYFWIWPLIGAVLVYLVSATPFLIYMISYSGATLLANALVKRVWQMPVLLMFFLTFITTFSLHFLTMISLQFSGISFSWMTAISQITLPSTLLNLILSLPVYILISDFVDFIKPTETEA